MIDARASGKQVAIAELMQSALTKARLAAKEDTPSKRGEVQKAEVNFCLKAISALQGPIRIMQDMLRSFGQFS
jgi:hypothetical protein